MGRRRELAQEALPWRLLGAVGAAAITMRLLWFYTHPTMGFGDSYLRADPTTELIKGAWLPLYQAILALTWSLVAHVDALRLVTIGMGTWAAVACAAVGFRLGGTAGLALAGGVVALYPGFVLTSTSLYISPLFLSLLGTTAALLLSARRDGATGAAAAACFTLAMCTRYEAWPMWLIVAPALTRYPHGRWLAAAPLIPAVAWVGWWGGLGPTGTRSLAPHLDLLGQSLVVFNAAVIWRVAPLLGLGLLGLADAARRRDATRMLPGALFLGSWLFLVAARPYWPHDNPRQLLLPGVLMAWSAAGWLPSLAHRARLAVVALAVLPALTWSFWLSSPQGDEALSASVGRALAGLPMPHRVLVVADGLRHTPHLPDDRCRSIRVYSALGARVHCGHEVDGPLPEWLQAHHVGVVVRIGDFENWRPVHDAYDDWAGGVLPVAAPTRSYEARVLADLDPAPLSEVARRFPGTLRCTGPDGLSRDLAVEGAAVRRQDRLVAFFTNGSARWTAPSTGPAWVWHCGTPAAGVAPSIQVTIGDRVQRIDSQPWAVRTALGAVRAGDTVELRFDNDDSTADEDRNFFLLGFEQP